MGAVSPSINELEASIPELMEKNRIPGLSIALIDGESLVWAKGFGYTDLSKRHKVTADTLFSLQSISKTYTATGFLIAASKGLVKLDDPLKKYYPEFRVNSRFGEKEANKITFRHLLSHRSGLTHEAPVGQNYSRRECTFEEHIESISETWLKFPVGEHYSYSNLGMDLVGYALQRISGKPFTEYMKEELLEPLGMTNSTYDQRYVRENLVFARGHRGDDEVPPDLIPMIPAGSFFSTARDMAKFVSFHLSGGIVHGRRLINKDLLWEMYQQQFPVKNQICGYGLGVETIWQFNTVFLRHSGGGYGYLTLQGWSPKYKVGAVVLTNQAYHSNVHFLIANDALGMVLKVKFGSVPEQRPLKFAIPSVVSVETGKLHCLEGDYRVGNGLMMVRVKDGELYRTLPNGETGKLSPHSETEFTNPKGEPFLFQLDERGLPKSILILDFTGPFYCPLESSPRDDPGPDKAE
jgi:CubicO group peptidase (beta-lactamase class C family)